MTNIRIFVAGIGIISPLGHGYEETKNSVKTGKTGIKPISIFPVPHGDPLPAGEISFTYSDNVPRTHALALIAAKEALKNVSNPPDAIVLGSTTGGMPLTENLIKAKNFDPALYKYHSTGSVAEYIAEKILCRGIILTVSTACSSGALAVKLALEMLRTARREVCARGRGRRFVQAHLSWLQLTAADRPERRAPARHCAKRDVGCRGCGYASSDCRRRASSGCHC